MQRGLSTHWVVSAERCEGTEKELERDCERVCVLEDRREFDLSAHVCKWVLKGVRSAFICGGCVFVKVVCGLLTGGHVFSVAWPAPSVFPCNAAAVLPAAHASLAPPGPAFPWYP